jgi:hypothetical protein
VYVCCHQNHRHQQHIAIAYEEESLCRMSQVGNGAADAAAAQSKKQEQGAAAAA